ncbi:MAG: Crp/Fnr family transcriptional regulator [Burkholderiales bacterium]|nr:Crp/Fnr family transcriptional regulator [Burkholderiales bacterium]
MRASRPARREATKITSVHDNASAQAAGQPPALTAHHELVRRGRTQSFRKGVVIVQEGDYGDTLFIILSGRVKVYATGDDEREIVLDIHGPGEFVGEMALDGGPRSASVITLEPTTCSIVTRDVLREHIASNPDTAFEILAKVIARARRATANVKNLALLDVYGRVTRLLNELAVDEDGHRVVAEKLTHQAIAERVGASREMVSRLLKDLTQGGYVEVRDRQILIKKPLPPAW